MSSNVFFHSGDLGDCIASLPTIRQLGGGRLILGNRNGIGGREPMTQARFDVLAPLLSEQEYIEEVVRQDDPSDITHDFHLFRTKPPPTGDPNCGELGYNLATWQAQWFGITDVDLSPWLRVLQHDLRSVGRAILSRTLRYQNPGFGWPAVMLKYALPIFVGLPEEWSEFQKLASEDVDYIATANLLEVAALIAGSEIFVGNQSAPCWVAIGLGHRLIQEMDQCVSNRNSVVKRENADFVSC